MVMSSVKHFEGSRFDEEVLKSAEPVLVDFYADWCGPCRAMGPVVEELAGEYSGRLVIGKLDTDADPEIAMRYGIMSIPTLGLFKGGKLVDRMVGYPGPGGVRAWVERGVASAPAA